MIGVISLGSITLKISRFLVNSLYRYHFSIKFQGIPDLKAQFVPHILTLSSIYANI